MSKHTKGPWSYSFCGGAFYIYGANNGMVACNPLGDAPDGAIGMVRGVGRGASLEEQEANAALMARAPELEAENARLRSELDHLRGWREGAEPRVERLKVQVNELSLALSTLLDHIESNEGKVRPGEQCPNCTGVGPGEPVEACPYHDAWLALSIHG